MSTVYWPGDEHAGDAFTDLALLTSMVRVEAAWLAALVVHDVAPARLPAGVVEAAAAGLDADVARQIAVAAEPGGNAVIAFVGWLRDYLHSAESGADSDDAGDEVARWVHRGLTSQDVLDTALMLQAQATATRVSAQLDDQIRALTARLAEYADVPLTARTLTQSAVPITAGARLTGWLHGLLDAAEQLRTLTFPAQFGGAAGTLSGAVALLGNAAGTADGADAPARARAAAGTAAAHLGLADHAPWHTTRSPVTRFVDSLAECTAAWGHIANDVLIGSRAEIGEFAEPAEPGRGGSSAMPQKANPVLSVLIRRAALTAPALVSIVHLAAADMHDERAAGAWHAEWQPLQLIARHTLTAGAHTRLLLAGLRIDADRMAANLAAAGPGVHAERESLASTDAALPAGADRVLVEAGLARAHAFLETAR